MEHANPPTGGSEWEEVKPCRDEFLIQLMNEYQSNKYNEPFRILAIES